MYYIIVGLGHRGVIVQLYQKKWNHFTQLDHTTDTLKNERRGFRRWLLLPYIAFILPIDDPTVIAQLTEWQAALSPWLSYEPQPAERLHITLNYIGGLRRNRWRILPHTWHRLALPQLATRADDVIRSFEAFQVYIGPLNAFPNVLFAEVQDPDECLRMLRTNVRRALPLRARPPSPWTYLPHVTLGHWGRQPAAPIREALEPYRQADPVPLRVTRVKFTIYTYNTVPLNKDLLAAAHEEVIAEFPLKS
jgi:2'-5' RNA ligase